MVKLGLEAKLQGNCGGLTAQVQDVSAIESSYMIEFWVNSK